MPDSNAILHVHGDDSCRSKEKQDAHNDSASTEVDLEVRGDRVGVVSLRIGVLGPLASCKQPVVVLITTTPHHTPLFGFCRDLQEPYQHVLCTSIRDILSLAEDTCSL